MARRRALPAAALLAAVGALVPGAAVARPSPEEVERAVEEVFSEPALREGLEVRDASSQDLLAAMWAELKAFFEDVARELAAMHSTSPVAFWVILALLVLLLIALLTHIGWTISLAFRSSDRRAQAPLAEEALPEARMRSYRELRREARRLAEAGALEEASRTLLLALLALLAERQVLAVARGWTNREVLTRLRRSFASDAQRAEELERFGAAVERVSYGGRRLTPEELAELDRALEAIASRVGPGQAVR